MVRGGRCRLGGESIGNGRANLASHFSPGGSQPLEVWDLWELRIGTKSRNSKTALDLDRGSGGRTLLSIPSELTM